MLFHQVVEGLRNDFRQQGLRAMGHRRDVLELMKRNLGRGGREV